jgi:hypothetical protein
MARQGRELSMHGGVHIVDFLEVVHRHVPTLVSAKPTESLYFI